MIKLRVFSILAAIFLVIAVALGSLLPINEPAGQVIADLNGTWLADVQTYLSSHFGGWLWQQVTVPLLVRPTWLLPLAAGILCIGAVTSLNWLKTPPRGHRRRS